MSTPKDRIDKEPAPAPEAGFFDDDDEFDWFDEDSDVVDAEQARRQAAALEEDEADTVTYDASEEAEDATPTVSEPDDVPTVTGEEAAVEEGLAAVEEARASVEATPKRKPRVPLPPPPVYVAPRRSTRPVRSGGYLDSILPRTLEPPRLATSPLPVGTGPEVVESIGVAGTRERAFELPTGEDAWRETVAVLELEAVEAPDRSGELLAQAAWVRLRRLGDREGARARLQQAVEAGLAADSAVRAEIAEAAVGSAEEVEAWRARAADLSGAAAADAWRRVAGAVTSREEEREALEAALEADPDDLLTAERLAALARAASDPEALRVALAHIVDRLDPTSRPPVLTELGHVLASLDRHEEARAAWRAALAVDADLGTAWSALETSLRESGMPAGLAALYEAEAARRPAEAGWWWWRAARAWRRAGEREACERALVQAVAGGSTLAGADQEAWLAADGRGPELVAAVHAALPADAPRAQKGATLYRLAVTLERTNAEPALALAAYRESAATGFGPAADAVEQALAAAGPSAELLEVLESRLRAYDLPRLVDLLAVAEVQEALEPDSAEALARYQDAARKEDLEALRGVARVARRRGDDGALRAALARLAELEADPGLRAANALELGDLARAAGDLAGAAAAYERAATPDLGEVVALQRLVDVYTRSGRHGEAAERLVDRAEAVSDAACVPWMLAAARIRLAEGDVDGALLLLDRVVERVPGQAVAELLRRRIAGARRPELVREALERADTEEARIALATLAVLDGELPDAELTGPVAEALRDLYAARADAWAARLSRAEDGERLVTHVVGAWHEGTTGPLDLLEQRADVPPSAALARLAEAEDRPLLAARCAEGTDLGDKERERLVLAASSSARDALTRVRRRLDQPGSTVGALVEVAGLAAAANDHDTRRRAHLLAARRSTSPAERAAHAVWAATLSSSAAAHEDAAAAWRIAAEARPGSLFAFEGLRSELIPLGDAAGLRALYAEQRPEDRRGLAASLDSIGPGTALDVWTSLAAEGALLDALAREHALAAAGEWDALFVAWTERLASTATASERERLERKRRWVLADKLAQTERALVLYEELHKADPDDLEVRESLARVAGARGDLDRALGMLRELIAQAATPKEAARYERRVAEVHLSAGDDAAARQALLDALDHDSEDLDALAALRMVSERTHDYDTLHTVLKRHAALVGKAERVELRRELARVAEDKLAAPERAIEAWRAVLEDLPRDDEALRRLFDLADRQDDLDLMIEVGEPLATYGRSEDRGAVLRRLGLRCERAGRAGDALRYLEAALDQEVPDAEAAVRLVEIHRANGDHLALVRVLKVQASLQSDDLAAVEILREAVRVELEQRHDRPAAHAVVQLILARRGDDVPALKLHAALLHEARRLDEALAVHERLEPALEQVEDTDDYDVRVELTSFFHRYGEMLQVRGQVAAAQARYERALDLNATHLPTLEAIGPLYVQAEAWAKAGSVYQRLLELTGGQGDPEQVANMFTMLGLVELHADQVDKAFRRFNRAVETFPNYPAALKGLARVYEARSDWNNVLQAFNNVIYNATRIEDIVEAYMTKGRVLDEQMQRPDKAQQHYERSLNVKADQPEAYVRLLELALRREAYEEVADYARRGLLASDGASALDAELHLGLALAQHELDAPRQAAESLERARKAGGDWVAALGDDPLSDAAAVRAALHDRLPR